MLESKHVTDSQPGPAYQHTTIGRFRFTRSDFKVGMWQEMRFPACGGYAEIDTSHIQPEGVLVDAAGVLAPREPGWMSTLDHHPIPAGVHRRTAITPAVVWCARPRDRVGSVAELDELFMPAGWKQSLHPGSNLFLIHGELVCDGVSFAAPRIIQIRSDEKTLEARVDSYAFAW